MSIVIKYFATGSISSLAYCSSDSWHGVSILYYDIALFFGVNVKLIWERADCDVDKNVVFG